MRTSPLNDQMRQRFIVAERCLQEGNSAEAIAALVENASLEELQILLAEVEKFEIELSEERIASFRSEYKAAKQAPKRRNT